MPKIPVVYYIPDWKPLWFHSELYSHYRICLKSTPFGLFQCHQWKYKNNRIFEERWIKSLSNINFWYGKMEFYTSGFEDIENYKEYLPKIRNERYLNA